MKKEGLKIEFLYSAMKVVWLSLPFLVHSLVLDEYFIPQPLVLLRLWEGPVLAQPFRVARDEAAERVADEGEAEGGHVVGAAAKVDALGNGEQSRLKKIN